MSLSLAQLKEKLVQLGVDTATPGLSGDARLKELDLRYCVATNRERISSRGTNRDMNDGHMEDPFDVAVPSLSHLSMAELRSRLIVLGVDTNTPGQTGDDRRTELMKRLVAAICGDSNDNQDLADSILDEMIENNSLTSEEPVKPVEKAVLQHGRAPPTEPPSPKLLPVPSPVTPPVITPVVLSADDINEIKRDVKRLSNKRALVIASRLSGTHQDDELKRSEKTLSRTEAEIARIKSLKLKSASEKVSSILIDSGSLMFLESLRQKLESLRIEMKESIKCNRLRIRKEEDTNHEYGLKEEERLNSILQEAIFQKGRDKRRGDECRQANLKNRFAVETLKLPLDKNFDLNALANKVLPDDEEEVVNDEIIIPIKSSNVGTMVSTQAKENFKLPAPVISNSSIPTNVMKTINKIQLPIVNVASTSSSSGLYPEDKLESKFWQHPIELDEDVERTFDFDYLGEKERERERDFDYFGEKEELDAPNPLLPYSLSSSELKEQDNCLINKNQESQAVGLMRRSTPVGPRSRGDYNNADSDDEDDDAHDNAWAQFKQMKGTFGVHDDDDDDDDDEEVIHDFKNTSSFIPPAASSISLLSTSFHASQKDNWPVFDMQTTSLPVHMNDEKKNDVKVNELQEEVGTAVSDDDDDDDGDESEEDKEELARLSAEERIKNALIRVELVAPIIPEIATGPNHRVMPPPMSRPSSLPPTSNTYLVSNTLPRGVVPAPPNSEPPTWILNNAPSRTPRDIAEMPSTSRLKEYFNDDCSEDDEKDENHTTESGEGRRQIRSLLDHAKILENLSDYAAAEYTYEKALELDPMELTTLDSYAVFLHRKKGEIARAEAFFRRAVQLCIPQLVEELAQGVRGGRQPSVVVSPVTSPDRLFHSPHSCPDYRKIPITLIVRLLLNFAAFTNRGKGDVEGAFIIYRKAFRIDEKNAMVCAHFAHFLAEEGGDVVNSSLKNEPTMNSTKTFNLEDGTSDTFSISEAERLYTLALKSTPGDAKISMWYAKLLKKLGKFGQAELMYKVAYENSVSLSRLVNLHNSHGIESKLKLTQRQNKSSKLEATIICNYATFIYRQRKDITRALEMFVDGMRRYPTHRGLLKNFSYFLQSNNKLISEEHPSILLEFRHLLK